jgi:hypothetical protein
MNLTWSSIIKEYCEVCLQASKDDTAFSVFRTNPIYRQVVEHTTREFGLGYLEVIKRDNPELLNDFNKFLTNDNFGLPLICNYKGLFISPSTLRYIKILSDLIKHFGSLEGFRIAEIGGGYGGQCKIIKDIFDVDYHIIDLPEVNLLAEKFLKKTGKSNIRFSTWDALIKEDYDLVISIGGLTELNREIQYYYNEMIIKGSKRGYMIGSVILNPNNCYQIDDYKKFGNVVFIEEEPETHWSNFTMKWTTDL